MKKEKDIAYILDFNTLAIKDIQKVSDFTIEYDDETNAVSNIKFAKKFTGDEKDFVLLKKEGNDFLGIFDDLTEIKDMSDYNAKVKDVSNIFDEKIFLSNEELIKSRGIEDFIKHNIETYFSKSYDPFANLDYIKVAVRTHTILQKSVELGEDGLYNFHTFITNCKQNYDIHMNYTIKDKILEIIIEKKEQKPRFIDCTVADILNYKKIYGKQITSKVEVFCKDTGKLLKYCLDCNRNVKKFEDIAITDRVLGKTERICIEKEEEAFQNAVDKFKGNDYNYLIQFSLNKNSSLMTQEKLLTGTEIKIKTKDNLIVNGYITARIEKKGNNIIDFKSGKIRRNLRSQLRKEKIK